MIVPIEIREELVTRAEAAAKAEGLSFREFVARALERALTQSIPTQPKPFVQRAHDFGTHLESPWTLLAEIEGEAYMTESKK